MEDIEVKLSDVIRILNEAVEADPDAMRALVFQRVPCNEKLAKHPTIQVGDYHGKYQVGVLGLLNGIFGARADGLGYLCANFEVVCPNGHDTAEGAEYGGVCPFCAEHYTLGRLIEFKFAPLEDNNE